MGKLIFVGYLFFFSHLYAFDPSGVERTVHDFFMKFVKEDQNKGMCKNGIEELDFQSIRISKDTGSYQVGFGVMKNVKTFPRKIIESDIDVLIRIKFCGINDSYGLTLRMQNEAYIVLAYSSSIEL